MLGERLFSGNRFQSDQEAWLELCNLYILENDFVKAAFCMEELIMAQPHNHLYHQRYAELQFLIATTDSVELARSYFAQVILSSNCSTLWSTQETQDYEMMYNALSVLCDVYQYRIFFDCISTTLFSGIEAEPAKSFGVVRFLYSRAVVELFAEVLVSEEEEGQPKVP